MLNTVNSPSFGATYGISVVKLGQEGKKAQASLEPAIKYVKESTKGTGSEITATIGIKDGFILIAKEVEFLVKGIRKRLIEEGIPKKDRETMLKKRLESEAYNKIFVNA